MILSAWVMNTFQMFVLWVPLRPLRLCGNLTHATQFKVEMPLIPA